MDWLYISDCPKLKGDILDHLPALQTLKIINCKLLASFVPRAPNLQKLKIRKSNKVAFYVFPLLVEKIYIEGSPMVETMMEAITIIQPICLKYLSIKDCSSTISFPNDQLHASLRTLNISGLNKLKFSCDTNTNYWKHFQYIISLPITYYDNMETLLVLGSESYKSLIHFRIGYCPNFVSIIPREGLFVPNLTRFIVHDYDKLKSLPD